MDKPNSYLTIVTPISDTPSEEEIRGGVNYIRNKLRLADISTEMLATNLSEFFDSVSEVLKGVDDELLTYKLKEIELSATITAQGKFTLVAGELGGSLQGAIKFKFVKD